MNYRRIKECLSNYTKLFRVFSFHRTSQDAESMKILYIDENLTIYHLK